MKISSEELEVYMKMYETFVGYVEEGRMQRHDYAQYVKTIVNTHYIVLDQLAKIDEKFFDREVEKTLGEDDV